MKLKNRDPRWVVTLLVVSGLLIVVAIYAGVVFQYLRITPGEELIWREAQKEVADIFLPSESHFSLPEKPEKLNPQTPIWFCFDPRREGADRSKLYLSEQSALTEFAADQCEVRSSPDALELLQLVESIRIGGARLDVTAMKSEHGQS